MRSENIISSPREINRFDILYVMDNKLIELLTYELFYVYLY